MSSETFVKTENILESIQKLIFKVRLKNKMVKSYTFNDKDEFSKIGTDLVCRYLKSIEETQRVENVESDPNYQRDDIDLLWTKGSEIVPVEVKTDSYATGNFWLETISNEFLRTEGCFLKTKAKYLFYYFIKYDNLYIIPMEKARKWFLENMHRFKESRTTTKDENGEYTHTTVGRIVAITTMVSEVKEIELIERFSEKVNS